jgi:toluene monooxygenase system ferredoxin subunit
MRGVVVHGRKVLLVRTDDGVHAYEDRCAHQGALLSEGTLAGRVLTCSAHQWQYDACTGAGINPSSARLVSFPVEVVGDDVFVDVERAR